MDLPVLFIDQVQPVDGRKDQVGVLGAADAPRLQEAAAAGHRDGEVAAAQPGKSQDVVADGRGGQVLVGGVEAFVAQRRGGEGKGAVFRERLGWGARSAAAQAARRRRLHEVGVDAERPGRQRDEAGVNTQYVRKFTSLERYIIDIRQNSPSVMDNSLE